VPSDLSRQRSAQRAERVKRRRTTRLKRWLIVGAVVAMVSMIGVGVWLLAWRSDILAIREVRIDGVDGKLREAVQQAAMVPIGQPLVTLPATEIQARVQGIEWVRQASVRASWPDAVDISVEPRTGVGQDWVTGQLIDIDGVVFTLPGTMPSGLPVVRASEAGRAQALRALESLPEGITSRVTLVTASSRDDVRFTLDTGAVVRWGSAEQSALKAEVLAALLSRRALVYDVSSPLTPTTRGERRNGR